ncbi:MAG: MBL fold metallo-hydrolase [Bacteroidota bacterium]
MISVEVLTFNMFSENTYIVYDETKECVVIDPGCSDYQERMELKSFIDGRGLTVKHLLNTHAHIDHVLGNDFVKKTYGVQYYLHKKDLPLLENNVERAQFYGFPGYVGAEVDVFLEEGDIIKFGKSELEVIFVPGHAPGHVAFISNPDKLCISGDVLFKRSIGRTDFPLCNHDDLIASIRDKIFNLADDMVILPGHGPFTTVGEEKKYNPYVGLES